MIRVGRRLHGRHLGPTGYEEGNRAQGQEQRNRLDPQAVAVEGIDHPPHKDGTHDRAGQIHELQEATDCAKVSAPVKMCHNSLSQSS
jgi:hypothetical protein